MICEKCGIPFGTTFEKDKICPVCHHDNEEYKEYRDMKK